MTKTIKKIKKYQSSCCNAPIVDKGTYSNHRYTCTKCGKLTIPKEQNDH